MAAQPGGSANINAAAVLLADGRADDNPEEICPAGGAAGIYGVNLCKTEKFPDSFDGLGDAAFWQYTDGHIRRKAGPGGWHIEQPHLKQRKKAVWRTACSTARSVGIMTDAVNRPIRKTCRFLI